LLETDKFQFGIIGGGVMGEAILSRLLNLGVYAASDICISDPSPERRQLLADQHGVVVTSNNSQALTAKVILLAIKPQIFEQGFIRLELNSPPALVISIMAGVTLLRLESAFEQQAVIRAMPNTPAQIGCGITALASGKYTTTAHLEIARTVFAAVGEVVELPESMINAVTGLSGSGPAYVALMIESLADGGVAAGLPRAIAMQLATQTLLGTAELLKQTGWHPGELKDRVSSPGGTTIMGLRTLEKHGMRSAVIEAVLAATQRAKELG
jgi:pyrroline-5-carboxylate reductase